MQDVTRCIIIWPLYTAIVMVYVSWRNEGAEETAAPWAQVIKGAQNEELCRGK